MTPDFGVLAAALLAEDGVSDARMFGSRGLSCAGKYFALEYKGDLVVKVAKDRAEELVASGIGSQFDPGHGRKMKQWVAIGPDHADAWQACAREALEYARAGAR